MNLKICNDVIKNWVSEMNECIIDKFFNSKDEIGIIFQMILNAHEDVNLSDTEKMM